ncbi:hypothetical protein [Methylocystis sp. Sn-Cys]|uniref:hypothetical protein n=1 Tax=Methylocystis sp. Sn-Cys TaxID=1701263 RepID=UPI0019245258|nr:hypothetical protein [Methylocystis sp. Sn-Cys]MBL1256402.1 hypothetical protein [Methylocystis sp. Sn-Cys]
MADEPENLVLQLLREMRGEMADMRSEMHGIRDGLRTEIRSVRDDLHSEINSLRADVASDFLTIEKRLGDQIVGLRRAVVDYHSSVVGHGVIISELEARMRRVEQHLDLPPLDKH